MMYSKIFNPNTKKFVNITSTLGKKILNNYLDFFLINQQGGLKFDKVKKQLDNIICPISQEIMVDPVILESKITYERASIEKWLKEHDICPVTKIKIDRRKPLTDNVVLKNIIENIIEELNVKIINQWEDLDDDTKEKFKEIKKQLDDYNRDKINFDSSREERQKATQEAARLEAARLEAARQEAARQEAARREAARREAARQEAARREAARQEAARREAARQEAARREAARQEAAREAARQEAERLETLLRNREANIECVQSCNHPEWIWRMDLSHRATDYCVYECKICKIVKGEDDEVYRESRHRVEEEKRRAKAFREANCFSHEFIAEEQGAQSKMEGDPVMYRCRKCLMYIDENHPIIREALRRSRGY